MSPPAPIFSSGPPMTLSRRIIAAGFVLYGLVALVAPSTAYTSSAYEVVFSLAEPVGNPLKVWGAAFLVSGIAGLCRGLLGTFLMIGTLASWSLGLWLAVFTGVAGTWAGPIWPTLVVILLMLHAGRRAVR